MAARPGATLSVVAHLHFSSLLSAFVDFVWLGGGFDSGDGVLRYSVGFLWVRSGVRLRLGHKLLPVHLLPACRRQALLNPSAAEPLVWPSSLKFISELDLETKDLLEAALMEGNRERELKILKATKQSLTFPAHSDTAFDDDISEDHDAELCLICFYRDCNMEVQDCKHHMCAHCILALCCYGKPNLTTLCLPSPVCPFCPATFQSW